MSSPDSHRQDSSGEAETSGREGSPPYEALLSQSQRVNTVLAVIDGRATLEKSAEAPSAAGKEVCGDILVKMREIISEELRKVSPHSTRPAAAAEDARKQVLQMERSMLWKFEIGRLGPRALRLPRPSIIGRALYDDEKARGKDYTGSTPAEIYGTISINGRHHLSKPAQKYVDRHEAGETRKMSSKLNLHIKPRFGVLADRTRGRYYAESARDGLHLTKYGLRLFADWPDWSVSDDDLAGDGCSRPRGAGPAGGGVRPKLCPPC